MQRCCKDLRGKSHSIGGRAKREGPDLRQSMGGCRRRHAWRCHAPGGVTAEDGVGHFDGLRTGDDTHSDRPITSTGKSLVTVPYFPSMGDQGECQQRGRNAGPLMLQQALFEKGPGEEDGGGRVERRQDG